jgi:hypothetical protein
MARKDERKRERQMSEARKADVDAKLATLRGVSSRDLTPDDVRGASSPIGTGSHSREERRKRR